MNPCINCVFAEWQKTANGRLHPRGDGRCTWKFPRVPLAKAFYYVTTGDMHEVPKPCGGQITRKRPHENCAVFQKA